MAFFDVSKKKIQKMILICKEFHWLHDLKKYLKNIKPPVAITNGISAKLNKNDVLYHWNYIGVSGG